MKSNRRKFLQYSGLTGISLTVANMMKGFGANTNDTPVAALNHLNKTHSQHFNMCGFAAPKLDVVWIGFIGLGNRGPGAVQRMRHIEGVDIKALAESVTA